MTLSLHCRRILFCLLPVLMIASACDKSTSLLDFEGLRNYLKLTPSQTEVISGHIQQVVAEVETYIHVVRQVRQDLSRGRNRIDDRTVTMDTEVEAARQRAVDHIRLIAGEIMEILTPDQQKRFDRIVLPDLRESPQELEFIMVQSHRDTFSALRVKPVAHIKPLSSNDPNTVSYDELKEKRTIVFGPGGSSTGLERFPIFVTATLVDSVLAEAEIRHTAPTDSIDGDAGQTWREAYYSVRHTRDMFTIRLILSTFLHESYTSLDRWVIFIEDDEENRHEPADIIENTGLTPPKPSPMVPRGYMAEGNVAMGRKARQIEILFPYHDAYGRQILGSGTRLLRLVLFDKKDPDYRTQGEWVLQ